MAAPFDFVLRGFDGAANEADLIVDVVLRVTFDNVVSTDVAIDVVDAFWTEDNIGASEVDATVSFAEDEASVVAASEVVAEDSSAEDVASLVATDDFAAADDVALVVNSSPLLSDNVDNVVVT